MSITSGACFLYAFVLHRATGYIELLISIYFSIINIKSDRLFACRRVIGVDWDKRIFIRNVETDGRPSLRASRTTPRNLFRII